MDAVQRLRTKAQDAKTLEDDQGAEGFGHDRREQAGHRDRADASPTRSTCPITIRRWSMARWPYPAYPPYYWPPAPGYYAGAAIATGIAFGVGVAVGAWALSNNFWGGGFGWGNNNINVNRNTNINVNGIGSTTPSIATACVTTIYVCVRNSPAAINSRASTDRMDFRGRDGEQVSARCRQSAGGDRAGAGDRPGGGDRPGAGNRPAAATARVLAIVLAAAIVQERATGPAVVIAPVRATGRVAAIAQVPEVGRVRALARAGGGGRATGRESGSSNLGRRQCGIRARRSRPRQHGREAAAGGGGFHGGGHVGGGPDGGGGGGGGGGGRRSDIRLKHDIALFGRLDNGLGFYRFVYNGSNKAYVGVMAQEVQAVAPAAVVRGRDGYLRVYYDRIGVKFQTL